MQSIIAPTSAAELAAFLGATTEGVRIRGAGRWLDAGHAVPAAHDLRLDAFAGVRRYVPDDLTISVGAATTIAELRAATAARGQWCPLEPWGDDAGSVGATIATATNGPFAEALGRPRDLVLGLECVDGLGRIVQAGGRVVKNVAGFDLTRLCTGSWGTLAVITEVHLRLRARPAADRSFAVGETTPEFDALRRGPYAPAAALQVDAADAAALGLSPSSRWVLRSIGHPSFVAEFERRLRACGRIEPVDGAAWTAVRTRLAPPARATQWRWDALSRRVKQQFDPRGVLNPGLLGERA